MKGSVRSTAVGLVSVLFALVACGEGTATGPETGADAEPSLADVSATPKITHPTARETICAFDPGESRIVNGVVHFHGRKATTRAVSDDPRYTGTAEVVFRGRQDVMTRDGSGFGRFSFEPDGIDGTWEGTFTGEWNGGLFSGRGVAHGTGELQGLTLNSRLEEYVRDADDPVPCDPPVPTQFRQEITIIDPGS